MVSAFLETSDVDCDRLVRAATPFGAGIGRTNHLCGLVSGGVIVLGVAVGRNDPSDSEAKEKAYAAVAEFLSSVETSQGSTLCQDILGSDLSTAEGRRAAETEGLFVKRCHAMSVEVAGILERLLERMGAGFA